MTNPIPKYQPITDRRGEQSKGNEIVHDVSGSVRIQIPLYIAETLYGLLDGVTGSTDDDVLIEEMSIVQKRLQKQIDKNYR